MIFSEIFDFKSYLKPYASSIFGQYLSTALLLIFGILAALLIYFVPKKYKLKAVLAASIIFVLLSSTIMNFII